MVLPVVGPAQRDHEFVAALAPHRPGLRKAEMMRIRRVAATQQARLQRDKSKVGFVPMAADLAEPEHALVDLDDAGCIQVPYRACLDSVLPAGLKFHLPPGGGI